MKIDKMLSESGNDLTAMLICEHCDNKQKITSDYNDNYYHTKVIPAIACKVCGMNRAGRRSSVKILLPNTLGHQL